MRFRTNLSAKTAIRLVSATLLTLLLAFSGVLAQSPSEKQLRVFAPRMTYTVPLVDHNGMLYVGLLELLEPLGRVESHVDKQTWNMKFASGSASSVEVEFNEGSTRGKLAGSGYELPGQFFLHRGRGLVPVVALGGILPRLLAQPVQLTPGDRLLIGAIGFSFTQEVRQNPARLVLSFPSPVNPMIATEPGHMRLTFTREPVMRPTGGGEQKFSDTVFQSSAVSAASGALQLTVNVSTPVTAAFSNGGKTITISAVSSPAQTQPPQTPAQPAQTQAQAGSPAGQPGASATPAPNAAPGPTTAPPPAPVAPPPPPRVVVVIDAAHGGSDNGAMLPGEGTEKDFTLELARLIQHELEAHGIATQMVRTADNELNPDQRAAAANSARILAYIAIHAAGEGHGVHLYTALLPPSAQKPTHKTFLPWGSAQASWLDLSGNLAGSIAAELNQRKIDVEAAASPLRPLNNIWAPALAVEVNPPQAGKPIKSGNYLQTISASVSAGVVAMRSKLEAAR